MLALLAAVLLSTPYVPVTCQTGYVATYRGGRVTCVNTISQASTSGVAASATSLACSTACVQDAEIQSVSLSKTAGWPDCSPSLGQVLTSAGATPTCATSVKATDLACTACVGSGEISGIDMGQISDTAVGELFEHHTTSTIDFSEPTAYSQWTTAIYGICERMTCADDALTADVAGIYRVSAHFSGSINDANQLVEMYLFLNGERVEKCSVSTKFVVSGDEQPMAWTCLVELARGDVLTLRFQNTTSSGKVLTLKHVNLNASRVF